LPETQAPPPQRDILRVIVETKRAEVAALEPRVRELRARALGAPEPRDFERALVRDASTVALIAEVKRRSPGAGEIRPGLDAAALAATYQEHGAAAVSVLTDATYFGGSLADLAAIREAVQLPLLRKDFTIDVAQVYEARDAGADAVLLIVRILDDPLLAELLGAADEVGLAALVEVHDAPELERALGAGARLVGINNRDLATFRTDLGVTESLLAHVPPRVAVVSESGIASREDVARVGASGVDAVLVGESLLRAPEPGRKVAELAGAPRVREGRPRA
jgi:indole-3-glycerol phosphate synthase